LNHKVYSTKYKCNDDHPAGYRKDYTR